MLKNLQEKKVKKFVFWVLICFILPGFIIWGFSTSLRSAKKSKASLVIYNRPVPDEEYVMAVRASELQLLAQLGEEAYLQLQKFFDLKSIAVQRLVMLAEVKKRRIRVSDKELVDYIQRAPMFQSKNGFDNSAYEQFVTYVYRMKPRQFEELTRQDIAIRKLVESVTRDIKVNDGEIREAYRTENEQLSLYYAAAVPADFAASITPKDQELEDYFKEHSADFKKPLSFNVEYLALDSATQAASLSERLNDGETLEAVAKEAGLAIKETGLFEQNASLPNIGWSPEVSRELKDAYVKQVLDPVEIEKKAYIFRVKERKEPYTPEFKEVIDAVRASLIKAESRKLAKEKIEAVLAKVKSSDNSNHAANLAKFSQAAGLKYTSTPLFSAGSYIEGVGSSDAFFAAGAKLAEGAVSDVLDLPSGFYIVSLKDKPAFDEQKFVADKEKFTEKALTDKKNEFFGKFVEELMKKALNLPPQQTQKQLQPQAQK